MVSRTNINTNKELRFQIAYRNYVAQAENTLQHEFWNFIKTKRISQMLLNNNIIQVLQYSTMIDMDGNIINQPEEIVNAFATFFVSVYIESNSYKIGNYNGENVISDTIAINSIEEIYSL